MVQIYGLLAPMFSAAIPCPPACFPTLHITPIMIPDLPSHPVHLFLCEDPGVQFMGFVQIDPKVRTMPPSPMQMIAEKVSKLAALPPPLAAKLSVDPYTHTPVLPATEKVVGSVLEDEPGGRYKSGEEMDKSKEQEYSE